MSDIQSSQSQADTIKRCIRILANKGIVDPTNGVVKDTEKTSGYVAKIHDDPKDELYGTVDVQEWSNLGVVRNYEDNNESTKVEEAGADVKIGYHEGVLLSAIPNNENGIVITPMLYSDVVFVTDPITHNEYITHISHAKNVQFDSHEAVSVGVTETKELEDGDDTPDYNELEKTGNEAHTLYAPNSAKTIVKNKDGLESSIEVKGESIDIKRDKAEVLIDKDKIDKKYDKAEILMDANQILSKYNAKEIIINDKGVYLGSGDATEPAVLGNQLADLMMEWLDALAQVKTATSLGPQPFVSLPQFIVLKTKINSYKSATSGFLSK